MPIHWNARGEIDGYAGKTFATFFIPTVNIFMVALIYCLAAIDPKVRGAQPDVRNSQRKVFGIVRLVLSGFMGIVGLAVLGIGAGLALDMSRIIGVGMALLIGVLGNFMGKIRPNYFTGIRTPWTLESPHVWIRTHRFGGRLMIAVAVLLLIACFTLKGVAWVSVMVSLILVMAFVPMIYSFIIYKKERLEACVDGGR
ncbi:MAG TPA: SdpI family protein [Verrucomicrobiae bacterium]|nr:SdpI family protein [Verrucomicrobiae bacterium]